MKISEKWLRSFVEIQRPIQEIAEILTMRGLEVEAITPIAAKLDHVVVAEIKSAEKHPNADRLRVCQVDDGHELLTIVCGAPNARAGIKVALAKIGAVLPGITIKKSKIRDVESYGMLCSVTELGLAEKSEGILELPLDAPVGDSITEYLKLDDNILDISITPNRGDCVSVLGIAREVAAIESKTPPLKKGGQQTKLAGGDLNISILNQAQAVCPLYQLAKITHLNPKIEIPIEMKERLRRSGVRSINVPVDVTNYVMFECGQPLHAFDAAKIKGNITVRFARVGEVLDLLNDAKINLDEQSLIISDDEGPVALAGIMGGKRTAVSEDTAEILLECAHFVPEIIARSARHFNLSSDSGYRFERGVDSALPQYALDLAIKMILEISEEAQVEGIYSSDFPVTQRNVLLRHKKLEKILGVALSETEIEAVFSSLTMSFEKTSEGLNVTIPSYRFDLNIEEDLIEEVLRVRGCDSVEAVAPRPVLGSQSHLHSESLDSERLILKTRGYSEIISYSFVDEKLQTLLSPSEKAIKLVNPISQEMGLMRTSLWTGLISTLQYNVHRHQARVRLFEQGLCFLEDGSQPKKISGLSYGSVYPESWDNSKNLTHFFDVKSDVMALLDEKGIASQYLFLPSEHPALHPVQSAQIIHKQTKAKLGEIGVLHPRLVQAFDLSLAPVLFELDAHIMQTVQSSAPYVAPSKFPEVRRDLSFLLPVNVVYQAILDEVQGLDRVLIQRLFVFDVYQGKGIPEGYRSLAIALIIQDATKTLLDEEVALLVNKVIDLMENKFEATLRE